MTTKISILDELTNLLSNKDKTVAFVVGFSKQFNISQLMRPFSSFKKSGYTFATLLESLIVCRLFGKSVNSVVNTRVMEMDDNTLYRMMNHEFVNWRKLLLSFAIQFMTCVRQNSKKIKSDIINCYVLDDSDVEKSGKTIEGVSKIYSHKWQRFLWGYKLLVLGLHDGTNLVPCDCSLHRENKHNNYGLKPKETERQYRKERSSNSCYQERYDELDEDKISVAVKMLKRSYKRGLTASYVLVDSWFVNDTLLKGVRAIAKGALHVIGICKIDKRKFTVDGKEYKSDALIKMNEIRKDMVHTSRKYRSQYFAINASYKGSPVKLFYIKYKGAKEWSLLLTTDRILSFTQAFELYKRRWSIEVLFKECKQYLQLGKGQNTDFCGQIADATIALITYTILTLGKRFEAYETIGGIFRNTQAYMLEKNFCERIALVFKIIVEEMLEIFCLDVDETIRRLVFSEKINEHLFILLNTIIQQVNEKDESCMAA